MEQETKVVIAVVTAILSAAKIANWSQSKIMYAIADTLADNLNKQFFIDNIVHNRGVISNVKEH